MRRLHYRRQRFPNYYDDGYYCANEPDDDVHGDCFDAHCDDDCDGDCAANEHDGDGTATPATAS